MRATLTRTLLFVAGLALLGWGMLPAGTISVGAAPRLLITEIPSAEPPTPVPPTDIPRPTATSEPVPAPSPVPTNPPAPTSTSPAQPPPDAPDNGNPSTPTATPVPATPTAAPTAAAPADPAISKSVSPSTARVGDSVTYTIIVTNLGGSTATGVTVEDTLPAILSPSGVTTSRGEASLSGQTVRVTIGDLAPGETVTITVQAKVVAQPAPPNNRNLATVSSTSPDGNPDNNQASVPLDPAVIPAVLPTTGDAGQDSWPLAAVLLGLTLIAASLLMRRRAA